MNVERRPFGQLPDARRVEAFDLAAGAVTATVLTYGATLASVRVPNTSGAVADVALGFDTIDGWLDDPQYFGSIVGRYANRIRHGRFPLACRAIQVTPNRGDHHLHGGAVGFDKVIWSAEDASTEHQAGVRLHHHSPDGDEGFPGELDVTVTYQLDPRGTLTIRYEAVAGAPTVVNLTNHVYLNLAGAGTVLDHEIVLHGGSFLPVDDATLPTGEVRRVTGTPMDLRRATRIGDRVDATDLQVRTANGFDHCWVVDGTPGELRPCATVTGAGRSLKVATTQPGVQFYTGQGIRPRPGRDGASYGPHSGFCLETQHFPDSPNHEHFPSTRLEPGQNFTEVTALTFGAA